RDQEGIDVHAKAFGIFRVKCMFGVYKCAYAAFFLGFRNDVQRKSRFTARLWPKYFYDASARESTDAERPIYTDGAGRDCIYVYFWRLAKFHYRIVTKFGFDIRESAVYVFVGAGTD